MRYYLGVDIGTTATKAVAFSEEGTILAIHSSFYGMQHPQEGWSEQDPNELYAAVQTAIRTVVSQLAPHAPLFVSFSAAMHSLIAVDDKGVPLSACLIWADNRAAGIAADLRQSVQGMAFYQATGVPIHPMSPLCKILWLRKEEPGIFQKAARFIGIKEYIFFRLFGEYLVDTSVASTTGLLNLSTLNWAQDILQFAGITSHRLSRLVPSTYILKDKEALPQIGLPAGIPFVVGASDGALANLGAGAMDPHTLAISIGTSSAIRTVVKSPRTDAAMRTFCYHLADDNYIVGGAGNNGAVVLQWLKEKVLQTEESYDDLMAGAEGVEPGSEGLIFAPYLLGERAPLWDPAARGVFMGLSIQHTRNHLVRAAIEGVIYCLYTMGRPLMDGNAINELRVSGGFARSPLPLQVLANVFNTRVLVSPSVESSAKGAVLLGARAMGINTDWKEEEATEYYPQAAAHAVYQERLALFEQIPAFLRSAP